MAGKITNKNTQPSEPADSGATNPSVTGAVSGTRTIPGPKDMQGNEIKPKDSPNKKYHADIAKTHGEHVVHTKDRGILFEGKMYGPGLVNCGPETRDIDGKEVRVSDIIRSAVDKYHREPEEEPEEVSQPMSPNDAMGGGTNQFTETLGVDVTPKVEGEDEVEEE